MGHHFIYLLFDPRNGMPFYVGMTKQPDKRLYQHINNSRLEEDTTNRNYLYIQSILSDGLEPVMEVVEKTPTREDAKGRERFWMGFMGYHGIKIVNPLWYSKPGLLGFIAEHEQYRYEVIKPIYVKGYVTPEWVERRVKKAVHHEFRERHNFEPQNQFEAVIVDSIAYIEYLEQLVMRYEKGA